MTASVQRAVVVAEDLSIQYPARGGSARSTAVNGATFELLEGEILAVVGSSGSGKSSLAQLIAMVGGSLVSGAPEITGGELSIFGTRVRGAGKRTRDRLAFGIGYLPQKGGEHLHPRLTVGESIAEPIFLRDKKYDQTAAGIAVATLIDAVRLPLATMNRFPHELSNGQRQRIAIARALVLRPRLLIADDPTAGIDVTVRTVILDIIGDLQRDLAFSALVVAQDLEEVSRITDRVLVMDRGVVVGRGIIDEVLGNPQHPYSEGLVRARNLGRRSQSVDK